MPSRLVKPWPSESFSEPLSFQPAILPPPVTFRPSRSEPVSAPASFGKIHSHLRAHESWIAPAPAGSETDALSRT